MKFLALATLTVTVSGAALKPRDGTCTIAVSYARGQNPIAGGDNSYTCLAKLTYADGSEVDLDDNCTDVNGSHCYFSDLPNAICVTSNTDLHDGYVDYGDEHIDFNGDGSCATDDYAGPSGDGRTQTCSFPC